jgi:multicomponent Na+:H+ antiporter subunit D
MNAVVNGIWTNLPVLQVVIPLLGALLVGFLRRAPLAFAITLAVSWVLPFIAGALLTQVLTGGPISYHIGGWAPPWGIEYRVDALNGFVLLLVSVVGAVTMPYALRSIAREIDEDKRAWFYCMYLLCVSGLLGIAVTGDAFNAFVFLEISSLSSYVLIALGRDRRALLAAFQYLVMGTIGATFYIIGVGLLYLLTGTLNMVDIAARLAPAMVAHSPAVYAALAFITVGISLKLALFPLHAWLPNAYAYAPSWATAFLAATATKVAIYLLIRYYFSIFGIAIDLDALPVNDIIIVLSVAAMFIASLVAVFESDLKRMLAYSSVAQIGYITLGIGLANQAGLTGGLVHIVNHALMKAALFLAVGAVFYRIGTVRLSELAGIGRKMPLTMTAFTIAGFGLLGTPGTSGFISKWYLAVGALDKGWWVLVFLIVASSLIAVVYVGRVLEVVWLREPGPAVAQASDPPLSMLLPMLVLAAATIYFGINTEWTAGIADTAAKALIGGLR